MTVGKINISGRLKDVMRLLCDDEEDDQLPWRTVKADENGRFIVEWKILGATEAVVPKPRRRSRGKGSV